MECDQCGLRTTVIHLAAEQGVRGREELERALPRAFFVTTAKMVSFLPERRFDDRNRDFAAGDGRFDGAGRAAVFETGAGALFWHRLRALDESVLRLMGHDPGAERERIDTLLRAGAGGRYVDRFEQRRRGTVVDLDDRETTMHSRIDTCRSGQAPTGVQSNLRSYGNRRSNE